MQENVIGQNAVGQNSIEQKVVEQKNILPIEPLKKTHHSVVIIVLSVLVVCLSIFSFFIWRKTVSNSLVQERSQESVINTVVSGDNDNKSKTVLSGLLEDEMRVSQNEVYPVTSSYKAFVNENNDGFINVTPLDTSIEPYTISKYGKKYNGGSLGLGSAGVVMAFDLEKFAFLDKDMIVVVSVDGQVEQKIELKGVQYINSWSPDSNSLLVYVSSNTIKNSFEPEGPTGPEGLPTKVSVDQDLNPKGFVLINFDKGTTRYMNELDDALVYSWAGNDALIISSGMGQYEYFIYYSLAEKFADNNMVSALGDTFGQQISFNNDGKKWAIVTSVEKNSTEMAQAAVGNFPKIGDISSIQFPWATRQGPKLSPQGDNLALVGYEVLNGPSYIYLYNGGNIEKIVEGRPELWIDDSQLLCSNKDSIFIYNVMDKEIINLR